MQMRKTVTFLFVLVTSFLASAIVLAEGTAQDSGSIEGRGMQFLAAALAIGAAASVGAIAQSKAASTALEGIARNPNASGKIFTPMILGLALIESLVIYALIIAFMIIGK
jgi:F-type H+-transporting ATPase subunit c